jgi:tetratricopeptide (TPR) repeat protein
MKKLSVVLVLLLTASTFAQSNTDLLKHFEAYYKQMREQGDVQGVINGLTHLTILEGSQARKDTLALIYMSEDMYVQALNTIGIENNASDSDIAIEIKAVSLKALNENERSLVFFEKLFNRNPSVSVAYELTEIYIQLGQLEQANTYATYGVENSTDKMGKTFYEMQQPYQVPLKAAFIYLQGLIKFNENKTANIDAAAGLMDEALKLAPNFNLAQLSKDAILNQKPKPKED